MTGRIRRIDASARPERGVGGCRRRQHRRCAGHRPVRGHRPFRRRPHTPWRAPRFCPNGVEAAVCVSGLALFGAEGLDWFAGMAPAGAAELRAAAAGRAAQEAHFASAFDPELFTTADHAALAAHGRGSVRWWTRRWQATRAGWWTTTWPMYPVGLRPRAGQRPDPVRARYPGPDRYPLECAVAGAALPFGGKVAAPRRRTRLRSGGPGESHPR